MHYWRVKLRSSAEELAICLHFADAPPQVNAPAAMMSILLWRPALFLLLLISAAALEGERNSAGSDSEKEADDELDLGEEEKARLSQEEIDELIKQYKEKKRL